MLTRERIIAEDARTSIASILSRHDISGPLILVCDDATWVAAGQQIHAHLTGRYAVKPHSLGRNPVASISDARTLMHVGQKSAAFIAVGAGTVNDVTKYAAAQLGKPYICVATAASMNGYTSATASLMEGDLKSSHLAKTPLAVIADMTIIAAAPKRLTRAGLGDTLCRSSVEADMLLSHFLLSTPYPKTIFDKLRSHERHLITIAGKLRDHDRPSLIALMEALFDAGDSMTQYGSSAIASQAEHMIAHTAEMIYGNDMFRTTHGETIAVTSLTMGHLQHKLLLMPQPIVKSLPRPEATFARIFGKEVAAHMAATYQKKFLTPAQAADITARLSIQWPRIKQALAEILLPTNTIERAFVLAGVPTRPRDINLDGDRYKHALNSAMLSRERFTFLDFAVMNDKAISSFA